MFRLLPKTHSQNMLPGTQDYVSVFYRDAENADDKTIDYVSVFWQNKDAEKERKGKKSQLTVLSATEVFLSMTVVPIIGASPTSMDASMDVLDTSPRLPESVDLLTFCKTFFCLGLSSGTF